MHVKHSSVGSCGISKEAQICEKRLEDDIFLKRGKECIHGVPQQRIGAYYYGSKGVYIRFYSSLFGLVLIACFRYPLLAGRRHVNPHRRWHHDHLIPFVCIGARSI